MLLAAAIATVSFPAPVAAAATLHWSSAYYVAWDQGNHPPSGLPWNDFSVLIHFSVKTSSARNGTINTTTHGMSPAFMQAAVAAAHQHGKKILLSIGGSDDQNWDAACSATYRGTFIGNLVTLMRTYGYDGLDLDVEQDFGSPAHTDFIACVSGIRSALNALSPRPMLTEPGDPSWQAYMIAPVAPYLDQINLMSYWGDVSKMPAEVSSYTSRGVPIAKLGIGLGLDPGMIDTSVASCQAKTAYAANNGLGVIEWIVTDAAAPPCMAVAGSYLAGVSPGPAPTPTPTARPTVHASPAATSRTTIAPTSPSASAITAPTASRSGSGPVALLPSPSSAASGSSPSTSSRRGGAPVLLLIVLGVALVGVVWYVARRFI